MGGNLLPTLPKASEVPGTKPHGISPYDPWAFSSTGDSPLHSPILGIAEKFEESKGLRNLELSVLIVVSSFVTEVSTFTGDSAHGANLAPQNLDPLLCRKYSIVRGLSGTRSPLRQ